MTVLTPELQTQMACDTFTIKKNNSLSICLILVYKTQKVYSISTRTFTNQSRTVPMPYDQANTNLSSNLSAPLIYTKYDNLI